MTSLNICSSPIRSIQPQAWKAPSQEKKSPSMIPHHILIPAILLVLSSLPPSSQKSDDIVGIAYTDPEWMGDAYFMTLGPCNKLSDIFASKISSYEIFANRGYVCRFFDGNSCNGNLLWEANDRSDKRVTGGDDKTKSILCNRGPFPT